MINKIIKLIKELYYKLFTIHCPYCKSRKLRFIGDVSSDFTTDYWWDLKDCNNLGSYHHKEMECLKCGKIHNAP